MKKIYKNIIHIIAIFSTIFILFISLPKTALAADCCIDDSNCSFGGGVGTCTGHDFSCSSGKVCIFSVPPEPILEFSDVSEEFNEAIGIKADLTSINGVISAFLPYIISFSGVILLLMLISGGFTMLTGVSNPEAADAGKQRITAAITGFLILFSAYWIIQILEIVLGINILGS